MPFLSVYNNNNNNNNNMKNEIKNVQTISKDINMNFGLEKCARICLKEVGSKAKCI
jgi:hypothetical protein